MQCFKFFFELPNTIPCDEAQIVISTMLTQDVLLISKIIVAWVAAGHPS